LALAIVAANPSYRRRSEYPIVEDFLGAITRQFRCVVAVMWPVRAV
jgi:hypothetical protein